MTKRDDRPTLPLEHEPLNREERRRARFGRGRSAQASAATDGAQADEAEPWAGEPDSGATTGRPDQDVTRMTGAGAAGATESDGRITHHEGIHLPNRPNG